MRSKYTELNDWQFYLALSTEVKQMKLPLKKIPKSPYWITNFRINGKKVCHSTKETTKAKAKIKAELIWTSEMAKLHKPKTLGSILLSQAIDHYKTLPTKNGKPRGKHDISILNDFKKKLGNKPLGKITTEDLTKIRGERESTSKGQTINRRFRILMALFNYAVKRRWIDKAPIYEEAIEQNAKKRELYTQVEIGQLIQACYTTNNEYLINPIMFALCTAFRLGEIRQLKKDDVAPCKTKINLREQKNGDEDEVIVLNTQARTILMKALLNPSEYVFFSPRSKDGSIGDISTAFTTVRKAADLHTRKVFKDFHSLRHTSTTKVAEGVKNIIELKQFTRHKSFFALDRYLHLFDNRQEIAELASFEIKTGATTGATFK